MKTLVLAVSVVATGVVFAAEVADAFVTEARQLYLTDEYADCKKEAVSLYYKGADKPGWTNDYPSASGNDIVTWYRVGGTVRNVRDIGGWTGLRRGRVYRGTQLSVCKKDQVHYIDDSGKDFMLNTLGIKTDMDFRHESESGRGEYVHSSPLGPTVELVGAVIQSYTNIFVAGYKPALQTMMRTFADSTKYPIYMHCMGGADRTGSAAFILEGLCGVSEPDLRIDYELTSFSGQGSRKSYDPSEENWFQQMYAMMKAYPGGTWSEKIENYCKTFLELTDAEIASIRANLMSTPGRSFVYTEDTTVTEALALDDDVLIDVYPGVTVTYSGEVSGAGRLFKVGEGTLVLGGVNSFTGSLEAEKGTVRLATPLSAATKVVLGKGRVVCGVASALGPANGPAKVVWTAPEGTLDVNGYATTVLLDADSTPELAKGATGYEVINSTTKSPDVTVMTKAEKTSVYVRFSGKMTLTPSTKNMVLKNRRHEITGFSMGATMTIGEGTVIRGVTSYVANSGARTLTVTSEEPDCFHDLMTLQLGNSRFVLSSQAILADISRRGNLSLVVSSGKTADAGLQLPSDDSRLVVKSFTDGSGNALPPGVYFVADYFKKIYRGFVVVEGGRNAEASKSITWAGDAAADLATPSNWTDAEAQPLSETEDLTTPANVYAAHVTSGTTATISKTVFFSELQMGGDLSGFTVGTEGDTECLRIDGAGITFAAKTDAVAERTFEFFCPVILNSSAALTIPAGDRLIFHNGASINADGLALDGGGTLELVGGVNYIDGDITMTDGSIAASGVVTGGGSITIPTGTRKIWLNGADFDVPVTVTEAVNLAFDTTSDAGTTNVIRNFATKKTSQIAFREDHVFVIDGLAAYSKISFAALSGSTSDGATVIVRDVTQGNRSDGIFAALHSMKLILDSSETGTGRKLMIYKTGGRIEFARNNWFSAATAAMATAGAFESDAAGRYDLGVTHQFCSYIEGNAAIDGAAGSVVEIACGADMTHSGGICGEASLVMNGAGTQTLTGASTTEGDLIVKKGLLVLSGNATWKNVGTVLILGGTLDVGVAKPFDETASRLEVAGEGVLQLSGVSVRVASAAVDGAEVDAGRYSAAHPGPFGNRLTGTGSVMVGDPGLMIIVR